MQYCKDVLLPVRVPVGDYCWNHKRICPQFDCEGGHPQCAMGFSIEFHDDTHDVRKPKGCLELKDA